MKVDENVSSFLRNLELGNLPSSLVTVCNTPVLFVQMTCVPLLMVTAGRWKKYFPVGLPLTISSSICTLTVVVDEVGVGLICVIGFSWVAAAGEVAVVVVPPQSTNRSAVTINSGKKIHKNRTRGTCPNPRIFMSKFSSPYTAIS